MASWSRPLPPHIGECISYDPVTGKFTRLKSPRPSYIGKDPASPRGDAGYMFIFFEGKSYAAQRVAWFLSHGEDPGLRYVDHRNGDVQDNRLENLRLADHHQNMANRKKPARADMSMPQGVHYNGSSFVAAIKFRGDRIRLGTFARIEDAAKAYSEAALWLRGEWVRSE